MLVVGSLGTDVTAYTQRFPRPGETVIGSDVTITVGGKGANQAIAAALSGSPTWMVGCVGSDAFAEIVRSELANAGVQLSEVRTVGARTGVAHIRVDGDGANDIVIAALANHQLDATMAETSIMRHASRSSVLLLQLEIRQEIACHAAAVGSAAGLTVILDPAPALELPAKVWQYIDIVTPNESEATTITGLRVDDAAGAERAGQWFLDRGVRHAVITLGSSGVVHVTHKHIAHLPAHLVQAVDTTGAGDAFTGALGAALARGETIEQALRCGVASGALATTARGAGVSMPTLLAIRQLLGDAGFASASVP